MITKKCKICGTEFQTKNNKGTYCSNKCRSQAYRDRNIRFYTVEEVVSVKYDSIIKNHEWKILEYVRILKMKKAELEDKKEFINQLQKQLIDYAFKNNELQQKNSMKEEEIKIGKNEILQLKTKKQF
jgi:hypothetical protein